MRERYNREKKEFYKKVIPVIAILILIMAIILEVLSRISDDIIEITIITTIVNWVYFAIFVSLALLVRKWIWPSWFVCPLMTIIIYYYFAFVDYNNDKAVIFFT
jgi:hypothetical protein